MKISVNHKKIAFTLAGGICFLILANLAGIIAKYYGGYTSSYLIQLFNLDVENNVPTYFSSLLLFSCAPILGVIAIARRKQAAGHYWYWMGLAIVFLFLSIDESVQIHERIGPIVREAFSTSGVFHFAWIIPYGIFVLTMGAIYIPFVLKLPAEVKKLMIYAALIFVTGALGMEAAASYYYSITGETGFTLALFTAVEESMEMFGILIFLRSLMHYLDLIFNGLQIQLSSKRTISSAVMD